MKIISRLKRKLFILLIIGAIIFSAFYFTFTFTPKEYEAITNTSPSNQRLVNIQTAEKVLCYIPIENDKLHVAKVIKETWGSKCDKLLFYGHFNDDDSSKTPELGYNLAHINVTEGYEFLWGKTKATLTHLHGNYGNEFNWFLKADYDTFIIMENLKRFINTLHLSDKEKPLWFGYKMKHKKMKHGYMSGGAGYVMNSKALASFSKLLEKHKSRDFTQFGGDNRVDGCKTLSNQGIEDLELGRCFHSLGIQDIPTIDEIGSHTFLPLSLNKLIMGDVSSSHWLWKQSWYPIKMVRKNGMNIRQVVKNNCTFRESSVAVNI